MTRLRTLLVLVAVAVGLGLLAPGRASATGVTREDAIAELQNVRVSIDRRSTCSAPATRRARPQRLPQPLEAVEIPAGFVTLTVAEAGARRGPPLVQSDAGRVHTVASSCAR